MKKLWTLLLVLILSLSVVFGMTACGDDDEDDKPDDNKPGDTTDDVTPAPTTPTEGVKYELSKDGTYYIVTGFEANKSASVLVLKATHENLPVKEIKSGAFQNNSAMKRVVLPASVEKIGSNAFKGNSLLATVNLEKVKEIQSGAFENCIKLKNVKLTEATSVEAGAFKGCTGLPVVENVIYADTWAVALKQTASTVKIKDGTKYIVNDDSFATVADLTIPDSLKAIPKKLTGSAVFKSLRFKSLNTYLGVTLDTPVTKEGTIDLYENGTKLTNVVIGSGVTSISAHTFTKTSITSVTIPANVTTVGDGAFAACPLLETVKISGAKSYLGTTFALTEPKHVYFDTLESYLNSSYESGTANPANPLRTTGDTRKVYFNNTVLGSGANTITIPTSVKKIPANAFVDWVTPVSIVYHDGIEEIGDYAFYENSTIYLPETLPASLKRIGICAFDNTSIKSGSYATLVVPDSVEEIGATAFAGLDVSEIVIGNGVKVIPTSAFARSTVQRITIGTGVETIEASAFKNCEYLTTLIINSNVKTVNDTEANPVFENVNTIQFLKVPKILMKSIYTANLRELEITYIGETLKAEDLPDFGRNSIKLTIDFTGLKEVEEGAFTNKAMFSNLYVTNIEAWLGVKLSKASDSFLYRAENIYVDGTRITELRLSNSVTEIKPYTLYKINSQGEQIEKIYIPASVGTIGKYAISSLQPIEVYVANFYEALNIHEDYKGGADAYYHNEFYFNHSGVFGENAEYKWYVRGDGKYVLYDYLGSASEIVIDKVDGVEIAHIKAGTFDGGVTSVKFANAATTVEPDAFTNCTITTLEGTVAQLRAFNLAALTKVIVTECGDEADDLFKNCTALSDVTLNGFTEIYNGMFEGCTALTTVKGTDGILTIGARAFKNTAYAQYSFTAATSIGSEAFSGTDLVSITLPAGVTVGDGAFASISTLREVTCPAEVITSIDLSNVKKVTFNAGAEIPMYAFQNNTSVEEVVFCDSIKTVGYKAFENCTGLKKLDLGAVETILNDAFNNARADMVILPATITSVGSTYNRFFSNGPLFFTPAATMDWSGWHYSSTGFKVYYEYTGEELTEGDLVYFETKEDIFVVGIKESSKTADTITIPAQINGKNVYYIFDDVFASELSATKLNWNVVDQYTNMWTSSMFAGLTNLKDIVTEGGYAITSLLPKLPVTLDSLTVIAPEGEDTFYGFYGTVEANKVFIDGYTYTTSEYALSCFYNVKELYLGDSFTSLNPLLSSSDTNLSSLEKLTLPLIPSDKNLSYLLRSSDNVASLKELTILSGTVSADIFSGLTLPVFEKIVFGKDVTSIEFSAFDAYEIAFSADNTTFTVSGNSILKNGELVYTKDGVIPAGVSVIAQKATLGAGVTELVIPEGVTTIGLYAFSNNTALEKVTLPSTLSVVNTCFTGCTNLKTLVTSTDKISGITKNYDTVVYKASTIPANLFKSNTKLKSIDISAVTSIGNYAFQGCTNLATVTVGTNPLTIGSYAFQNCSSLTSFDLKNVTSLGYDAFRGAKLTSFNLSSIKRIEASAIANTTVTSIELPITLEYLSSNALSLLTALSEIRYAGTLDQWLANVEIQGSNYVSNPVDFYFNGVKLESYTAPAGTTLKAAAFANMKSLTSVDLTGVKDIPEYLFWKCENLTSITLDPALESVGANAFSYTKPDHIVIPNTIKTMGASVFSYATVGKLEMLVSHAVTFNDNISGSWATRLTAQRLVLDVRSSNGSGVSPILCYGHQSTYMNIKEIELVGNGSLPGYSLYSLSTVEKVIFGEGITGINGASLTFMTSLKSVEIHSSTFTFNSYCFYTAGSLNSTTYAWTNNPDFKVYCDSATVIKASEYAGTSFKAWVNEFASFRTEFPTE